MVPIRNRPTIQTVADAAGVSRGTVDRVLNNRSHVSPDVRARVLDALKKTGYLPARQFHQSVLKAEHFPPVKLGVLLPDWTGHFKAEILRGIQAARRDLEDFHTEVLIEECESDAPQEILARIDQLTAKGAQGLSVCIPDTPAINGKIRSLLQKGIPAVTFNSDLTDSGRLTFIGQDYRQSGRIAAELISKCIPKNGTILAAAGNLEFDGHKKRLHGFLERMGELAFEDSQISIIETYNDYPITYRKVLEHLKSHPGTNAVYMANRSVAGCTEAVKAAGRKGAIRIICHDVAESTKLLLKDGSVDFAITQDLFQQGCLPLILLREYLQKGKMPDSSGINTAISIICSQNICP